MADFDDIEPKSGQPTGIYTEAEALARAETQGLRVTRRGEPVDTNTERSKATETVVLGDGIFPGLPVVEDEADNLSDEILANPGRFIDSVARADNEAAKRVVAANEHLRPAQSIQAIHEQTLRDLAYEKDDEERYNEAELAYIEGMAAGVATPEETEALNRELEQHDDDEDDLSYFS
jgi:hypothetical protein